jgi:hypothetical protein
MAGPQEGTQADKPTFGSIVKQHSLHKQPRIGLFHCKRAAVSGLFHA